MYRQHWGKITMVRSKFSRSINISEVMFVNSELKQAREPKPM
jgi:hypothetical protein